MGSPRWPAGSDTKRLVAMDTVAVRQTLVPPTLFRRSLAEIVRDGLEHKW